MDNYERVIALGDKVGVYARRLRSPHTNKAARLQFEIMLNERTQELVQAVTLSILESQETRTGKDINGIPIDRTK